MTNKELIEQLERYQRWRMGEDEMWSAKEHGPDPKEITKLIQMAIERLKRD